ncbi:MAG: starch-binding protein, partial [Bacteroidaceae bacterium]|nr:starch-binding protein [Bacteroidaceae bacterium]
MKKNILWILALVLPFMGIFSSCSSDEDIIFDHERQQFETRADRILLEFIVPFGTTADEEIYITGPFNGDSTAIGNAAYLLTKAPKSDMKWGIYLDPSTFINGKTLADGFRFYSVSQGKEYTTKGEQAWHTDNPSVGTFTNIWGQRWESYYWSGDEPEIEHDGFVVYVDNQTGWDAITLYMWGDVNNLNGDWPGMAPTGTVKLNGTTWTFFDMGADNSGLSENLIFNNAGGGTQLPDFAFTIDRDI